LLAIIVFATITGVCTPTCLLAASISVEAVTPPFGRPASVSLAEADGSSTIGCQPETEGEDPEADMQQYQRTNNHYHSRQRRGGSQITILFDDRTSRPDSWPE
jgi:hypothetical protein